MRKTFQINNDSANNLTIAPLPEPALGITIVRPEWIRLPKPGSQCPYSGLTRTPMYGLVRDGKIRSVVLRQRGKLRGIRLICYDSLIGYLRRIAAEQGQGLVEEGSQP